MHVRLFRALKLVTFVKFQNGAKQTLGMVDYFEMFQDGADLNRPTTYFLDLAFRIGTDNPQHTINPTKRLGSVFQLHAKIRLLLLTFAITAST